jgi:hypothetical protein
VAIEALDVLYVPSRDVEADVTFYRDVLGGRVIFAIEAMGTRVAEVAIGPRGPRVVILSTCRARRRYVCTGSPTLTRRSRSSVPGGCSSEGRVELPLGPCATFRSPGAQRLGLYQLTRPEVDEHFAGRADLG